MPVGYLISVLLFATCTFAALMPMRRPRLLADATFASGFAINELPYLATYLLVGSTLLAFGQGDIDSVGGWLAVGAAALTVVGLGVLAVRAQSSRATVERALRSGLGGDWRECIDPGLREWSRRRRLPAIRIVFGPFPLRPRKVERVKNIAYGTAGKYNLLDVYRGRSCPPGGPILVHFHGGHFRSGNKSREARPLFHRLASHGWVCVSANYHLGRIATFPDQLIDAKRVIAWVRAHGADYGGDTTTVFIAGSSAGGHMAAMAALTPNHAVFQPGFEQADTSVTAAIPMYAYYGSLDSRDGSHSSPFDYARLNRSPFFVVHGDHDTMVPVAQARAFAAELGRTSSAPIVYAELRGAQHAFDVYHSTRFESVIDAIEGFAAWVRSRHPTGSPGITTKPRRPHGS